MNHDDMHHDETSPSSDEFWGSTPDWSDATPRPRRARSESRGDVTGAIKNLWSSAMSSGAGGTREHHVLDANAPRPDDDTPVVGPTMFDDLDTEIPLWESNRAATAGGAAFAGAMTPTGEVPTVDAAGPPPDGFDDLDLDDLDFDDADDDGFAAMTPVPLVERDDNRRGTGGMKGGVDPLLVRIGAAAIATTLLVPFAIGWSSDDSDDTITSAADASAAFADAETAAAEPSTVATEPDTPAVLDAESLPPAVVVNPTPAADASTTSSSSSSSTAAAAPASASSATTQVEDCAIDYEVEFGDFWVRLADGAGVSLAELLDANGATTDTALFPGTTICLPAGAATPAPPSSSTTAAPTTAAPTTAAPTTAAPTTAAPTTAAPTTAAPSTAAPTTDPAPAPEPAGPEDIKQIIRDVWPDELEDRAIQIAYRESRFVPTAKNYCCYGLFQMYWSVHQSWLSDLGITDDQQLYDPATNARAAYALYQRSGGWGPWSMTAY